MKGDKKKMLIVVLATVLFLACAALVAFYLFRGSSINNSSNSTSGNSVNSSVQNQTENYCFPGSRGVQVCAQVFAPVCGYPVKKSFSNSCFACMDRNVEYYTYGQC